MLILVRVCLVYIYLYLSIKIGYNRLCSLSIISDAVP